MDGNTKPVVIVAVVCVIPVAVGRARVVSIVVPRAAAQHLPGWPDRAPLPGERIVDQSLLRVAIGCVHQ
jgi:hypothetical protein